MPETVISSTHKALSARNAIANAQATLKQPDAELLDYKQVS